MRARVQGEPSPLMINAAAECKTNEELSGVIPPNPLTHLDFI